MTIHRFAIVLLACLPALAADPPTIDAALNRMYNFDFRGAHAIFQQLEAASPNDPLPRAFNGSAFLFSELDRLGILESEFLTDDDQIADKRKKLDPDPAVRALFLQSVADADRLGRSALKVNGSDRNALFAMCIAQGVATDYMALVEKRQISSLSLAKKSNNYAQQLLRLDPKFYDAYLTAGITEYLVGSLPFFVRWFVHFDNVSGSKDRARQNLQLVARQGQYFRPFAKILLGIISLREKRPEAARSLLMELNHEFPVNPLFRKELAKLNLRLGSGAN